MEKCRGVTYKVEYSLEGSGAGAAGGDKKTPMETHTSYSTSYQSWDKAKRAESFKVYITICILFFKVKMSDLKDFLKSH